MAKGIKKVTAKKVKKQAFDMEKFAELVVSEFSTINKKFDMIDTRLDTIETTFEKRFASIELDIHEIKAEQRTLIGSVADLRRDVAGVENQLDNQSGYAKEIDYAFERLARVENHLGLPPLVCTTD